MPTFSRFTRYFAEVARLGSIRKASETLHISASAIDRQILRAEEEFGVALFERLPNGLRLTAAGEVLLTSVQGWEKGLRRTKDHMDELLGLRRGNVDISMIDALTEGFVPDALAELHRSYQGLSFDLKAAGNSEVVRQVLAHEVDFGLLLDPISGLDLQVIAFAEIPLGVAMPNSHPLAANKSLSLRDTLQYGLILPAAPLIVHQHVETLLQKQGIDCARLIRTNDSRMLRSLVKKGVGVGLLSWLDAHADINDGELTFARIEGKELKPMVLSLCIASHRQLSKAAQVALEVLRLKVEDLSIQLR